jgi:hypothetical protein
MEMTRFALARSALLALATLGSLTAAGCNKPSKEECRQAIDNMRSIMGTDLLQESDTQGWVRRCNGGSRKEAVLCAIKATTMDELRACQFMHLPNGKGVGDQPFPGEGSGTPSMTNGSGSSAGSATGSGASAATGSNVGSAAPAPNAGIAADTGSAAGSGATGSAAGSGAAGSASGSGASPSNSGSGGAAAGSAAPTTGGAGAGSAAPSMSGAGAGSAH